jgi:ACS family sodium-dependent inorganic phosphate cotransporter-like MFS transporter 5
MYALRTNLSVTLIAMVSNGSRTSNQNETNVTDTNDTNANATNTLERAANNFDWDSQIQSVILGAFFYGYIVTQIPAGVMATKISGRIMMAVGVTLTSVSALLVPVAAQWSWRAVVASRVFSGLVEGLTVPAYYAILREWAPPSEKSRIASIAYSGFQLGTILSLAIAGVLR